MHSDSRIYNEKQTKGNQDICDLLAQEIDRGLPEAENKIWHAHPVWFLDGNPIVGYCKLKNCIRLFFWSGQSFQTPGLTKSGSFKAAEARYISVTQIDKARLKKWLVESDQIQWDYKNIVMRKGKLERIK